VADALLDTTFFIDLRRGDVGAAGLWLRIRNESISGAYSAVSGYELWLSKRLSQADETFFTAVFRLLEEAPLTAEAAVQAAMWLRDLPRRTRDRRLRDAFIAASAHLRGETVYTRNVADLRRFHQDVERY
jgi:predicted nucleic acid-binding protein